MKYRRRYYTARPPQARAIAIGDLSLREIIDVLARWICQKPRMSRDNIHITWSDQPAGSRNTEINAAVWKRLSYKSYRIISKDRSDALTMISYCRRTEEPDHHHLVAVIAEVLGEVIIVTRQGRFFMETQQGHNAWTYRHDAAKILSIALARTWQDRGEEPDMAALQRFGRGIVGRWFRKALEAAAAA